MMWNNLLWVNRGNVFQAIHFAIKMTFYDLMI